MDPETGEPESDWKWWDRQADFSIEYELSKLIKVVDNLKPNDLREITYFDEYLSTRKDLSIEEMDAEDEAKERWLLDDSSYRVRLKLRQ